MTTVLNWDPSIATNTTVAIPSHHGLIGRCLDVSLVMAIVGWLLFPLPQSESKRRVWDPSICSMALPSAWSFHLHLPAEPTHAHAPSIYSCSGHSSWFYFYLRIGSLTLITGWLKLWGAVSFPIPHRESSIYPSLVIQSTSHVQPSTFG